MAKPRSPPTAPEPPRVLVIEDELLIALSIEEMIREIGYRVSGVAYTVVLARQELAKRNFDAVLCDINIGGQYNLEIADRLIELAIPFAFVTGYDYFVEPRYEKLPILQKPFTALELCTLLESLIGPGSPTGEIAQMA
jgi:CheY-like chemotaxis protein